MFAYRSYPNRIPNRMSARVLQVGHARISERAEEHRGALSLDRDLDLLREGRPVAQVPVGPEIELPEIEREARLDHGRARAEPSPRA